jgi:hypothetical protein
MLTDYQAPIGKPGVWEGAMTFRDVAIRMAAGEDIPANILLFYLPRWGWEKVKARAMFRQSGAPICEHVTLSARLLRYSLRLTPHALLPSQAPGQSENHVHKFDL